MDKIIELANTLIGYIVGGTLTALGSGSFILALINSKKNSKLIKDNKQKTAIIEAQEKTIDTYKERDEMHLELQVRQANMLSAIALNSNLPVAAKEHIVQEANEIKDLFNKLDKKVKKTIDIVEESAPVIIDKVSNQLTEIKETGKNTINTVKEVSKGAVELYEKIKKGE